MLRFFQFLTVSLLLGALLGCASNPYSSPKEVAKALAYKAPQVNTYRIGPSDVISVNVWRNKDLSIVVPVRPDGKISVPLIGDVNANNVKPEQLAKEITKKLSTYIRDPQVSVVVKGMNSHEYTERVRVTGAVNSPISVPYRKGMTVLDLVLSAGGTNMYANSDSAILYRKVGKKTVAIPLDLKAIFMKGKLSSNYKLQPGDIITVPERSF